MRHNRLLMWQDQRFAYDRLGRLIHKQVGRHTEQHLRWNAEHQLESVQTRRGADTHAQSQRVYFEYDALGRRISKTNSFGSVFFVWEGLRLLQERHRSRITTLVYEPDSYVPLARIDTTPQGPSGDSSAAANDAANYDNASPPPKPRLYWFHTNPSGAPEELTDEEGRVHWRARYKSWGNLALQEQPEADSDRFAQPSLQEQNLRLQGQYFDAETGLCYNTFRYYDPDCGRFISQDPIGLAGGMNLYQFAPNAISWIDPWGWACGSAFSGKRGRNKAAHDLERNGFKIVGEEVTMKVNGKRIRADFVARDGHGNIHVFEAKHGSGRLTANQSGSGVFDMKSPSNTVNGIGGGAITSSSGKAGSYTVATNSARGATLGGNGATGNATFHVLKY